MRYLVEVVRGPRPLEKHYQEHRRGLPEGTAHTGARSSRSLDIDQGEGREREQKIVLVLWGILGHVQRL